MGAGRSGLKAAMITFESLYVKKVGGLAEVPPRLAKALTELGVEAEVYTPSHGTMDTCRSPVYKIGQYCVSVLEGAEPRHYVVGGGALDEPVVYPPDTLVEKSLTFAKVLSGFFKRALDVEKYTVVFHGHDWHSYPALITLNTLSTKLGRRDVFVYHVHLLSKTRITLEEYCTEISVCGETPVRGVNGIQPFRLYYERSGGLVEKLAALTVDVVVAVSKGYARSVERVMGPASWGKVSVVPNASPVTWVEVREVLREVARLKELESLVARLEFRRWLLNKGLKNINVIWGSKNVGEVVKSSLERYGIEYNKPFEADGPLVFAVGRLSRQKGFDVLVKAMDRLLLRNPKLKVVIAAAPSEWDVSALRELVESALVYEENLRVLPGVLSRDSTLMLYYAANTTAVPSRSEPFGLVALESMACGTPVSASRVDGLADIVLDIREHGQRGTGVLFEPANPVDLAEKTSDLVELVESAYRGNEVGATIRDSCTRWAGGFTWLASARRALEVYTRYLNP